MGRGHAEQLVPMIAGLPAKGKAGRILVSRGPGSFTGIRIGIATARALGIAWTAQVESYPTLALVAATAREDAPNTPLSVAMRAGHGEIFVQNIDAEGNPRDSAASLKPDEAAAACQHELVVGTMATAVATMIEKGKGVDVLPDARHAFALPQSIFSDDLSPAYGRGPDAKLPT